MFKIEVPTQGQENTRSLAEIMSLNDNGQVLIDQLKLQGLSSVSKTAQGSTQVINFDGTLFHEKEENGGEGELRKAVKELEDFSYKKYPLIDLGTNGEAYIAIFAQDIGVPGVVAVDVENQIDPESLVAAKNSTTYKDKNFPVLGLKIDMLELLKQLPPNSCNISLFAIDDTIIKSEQYEKELMEELQRVVPPDGLILANNSFMDYQNSNNWENLLKAPGFVRILKKVEMPRAA